MGTLGVWMIPDVLIQKLREADGQVRLQKLRPYRGFNSFSLLVHSLGVSIAESWLSDQMVLSEDSSTDGKLGKWSSPLCQKIRGSNETKSLLRLVLGLKKWPKLLPWRKYLSCPCAAAVLRNKTPKTTQPALNSPTLNEWILAVTPSPLCVFKLPSTASSCFFTVF